MGYGKRIDTLCTHLEKSRSFADVGCDHGYCSEYVLKNGLCENVVFSDVSKGSLAKAEKLLESYVLQGKAKGVLGDGFYGVPKDTETVLIAGMGGAIGLVLGVVITLAQQYFGFVKMPNGNFLIENYPVELQVMDLVAIFMVFVAVALAVSMAATSAMIKRDRR